jgi:hypothetical protein
MAGRTFVGRPTTWQGESMRKILFNGAIISAIFGAWSTIQTTRTGPRDWRLILMWVSWAATTAIAIGTIVKEASDDDTEIEF